VSHRGALLAGRFLELAGQLKEGLGTFARKAGQDGPPLRGRGTMAGVARVKAHLPNGLRTHPKRFGQLWRRKPQRISTFLEIHLPSASRCKCTVDSPAVYIYTIYQQGEKQGPAAHPPR